MVGLVVTLTVAVLEMMSLNLLMLGVSVVCVRISVAYSLKVSL